MIWIIPHPLYVVNIKSIKKCHSGKGLVSVEFNKLFYPFVKYFFVAGDTSHEVFGEDFSDKLHDEFCDLVVGHSTILK